MMSSLLNRPELMPNVLLLTTYTFSDLQDTVTSRQKLEGQRQENLGVQKVSIPLTLC
jgi:hypothetical protein